MNEQTNTRELKVYGQSGYKYKDTATIILKGKWLENAGFKIGSSIKVSVEENQIMIKNKKKQEGKTCFFSKGNENDIYIIERIGNFLSFYGVGIR